ncbi:reducing hydrogenase subunit alpha [Corynebacterium diphtheriae]|nr:reducing hydrogenase subunit alpha [Corynebacterium diphtheriae]
MSTTLRLDQFVDPFEAKVVYTDSGAYFDLSGLPRLDPMLVGRNVAEVPDIVKRLCGLCPVAHHLAGVRALDALCGVEVPQSAQLVRLLLHHGSILYASPDMDIKRLGKAVMAAAGSPGHFPDVAIPGGVRALPDPQALAELRLPENYEESFEPVPYDGFDMMLTSHGTLDPLGDHVTARSGEERITFDLQTWADHVAESRPGDPAPRPLVHGHPYRVGSYAHGEAMVPRSLAEIRRIIADPRLCEGEFRKESSILSGIGVGAVEGPRGLLVHRYVANEDGVLVDCQILTPTAQNEAWLASMLEASLQQDSDRGVELSVENSIRTANPCLPCSSAPEGHMGVVIEKGN